MGSAPAPPPAYDPGSVSAGQTAANLALGESAQAGSQVNQIDPFSTGTYVNTGVGPNGVPTYSFVKQYSPQQQQLLNEQQLGMGVAGAEGANLLSGANYGSVDPTTAIGS